MMQFFIFLFNVKKIDTFISAVIWNSLKEAPPIQMVPPLLLFWLLVRMGAWEGIYSRVGWEEKYKSKL